MNKQICDKWFYKTIEYWLCSCNDEVDSIEPIPNDMTIQRYKTAVARFSYKSEDIEHFKTCKPKTIPSKLKKLHLMLIGESKLSSIKKLITENKLIIDYTAIFIAYLFKNHHHDIFEYFKNLKNKC